LKWVINILIFFALLLTGSIYAEDFAEYCWNRIISPNGMDLMKLNIDSNQVVYAGSWGDGIFRKDLAWKEISDTISNKYINVVESGFRDTVFVSAWNGGLYMSADKGDKWKPVTDFFRNLKMKCLSIYKNGFMIAGTYGYGVFKSYNAGKNWEAINYKLCWRDINCLLAINDSIFIAGTNGGGVYRTTNSGSSWLESGSGIECGTITDIRKNRNNLIFVSTINCGIYYSFDMGATWQKYFDTNLHPVKTNNFTIIGNDKIFVATNDNGIIRFNPSLNVWEKTDERRVNKGVNSVVSNSNGYLFCSLPGKGVYYSNDGNSWSDSIYSAPNGLFPLLAIKDSIVISGDVNRSLFYSKDFGNSWKKPPGLSLKPNSISADSSLKIFLSTNIGLYTSNYDFSNLTELDYFKNRNVSVVSNGRGGDILTGINNTGLGLKAALYISRNGGADWDSIAASDKSIKVVAISPWEHLYYSDGSGLLKSTDFGNSWQTVLNGTYKINDIEFLNHSSIYIATDKGLVISADTGKTFFVIDYNRQKPSTKFIEVSVFGDIWVYLDEEQIILYSSDKGQTWNEWTYGYVKNTLECMEISPYGYLYISSASIFRTVAPGYLRKPAIFVPPDWPNSISHNSVFRWNYLNPAELYQIQLSEDNFSSVAENSVTAEKSWQICADIKQNTKYYLRIRCKTNATYGPWSDVMEFNTAGAGPKLISPPDKSIGLSGSINFTWTKLNEPYRFQLARDSLFRDIVADSVNIIRELCNIKNLGIYTRYFWRVSANKTGWSDAWSFTTKLAPPKLLEPLDSSLYLKQSVNMKWETAPGAQTYRLQVSDKYDFSNIVEDIKDITANFQLIELKDAFEKYFWRIKAFNNSGESEWSKVFMFYTSSDSPILIYPEDNSDFVLDDTTFRWDSPKSADFFRFQISVDSFFNDKSIVYDTNFIKDREYKVRVLDYGTIYFWRVRYYSVSLPNPDTLVSAWSDVKRFKVDIPKVILNSPPDKSDNLNLNTEFMWNRVNCHYYYLQVSPKEDFSSDIFDKDNILGNSYLNNSLEYETRYFWRVKGKAGLGEGLWSDIWSFSTKSTSVIDEINNNQLHVKIDFSGNNISIAVENTNPDCNFEIYSITGNLIQSGSFDQTIYLDFSGFSNGTYFLRIETAGKSWFGWINKVN
jgi:photosystem II stability/assembly factor-like uncharacterized protein